MMSMGKKWNGVEWNSRNMTENTQEVLIQISVKNKDRENIVTLYRSMGIIYSDNINYGGANIWN